MLPAQHRYQLRQKPQIFRQGIKYSNRFFVWWWLENQTNFQAAVIVPKHFAKTSVRRHQWQRLIVKQIRHQLPTLPHGHLVIKLIQRLNEPLLKEATTDIFNSLKN